MSPIERFLSKTQPEPNSGCLLWIAGVDSKGYGGFRMNLSKGVNVTAIAPRAAWLLFVGPIPEGMNIRHKCDTPACVNVDHLCLGSHQQNMDDKTSRGRWRGNQKIPIEAHGEIVSRYMGGELQREIASSLGLSQSHVSKILRTSMGRIAKEAA